ncbi:MAG: flagellar hook-basal body complex protein FliE [Novosphingobium sp.]|nr:flagellar hook-basal body complex protein FliE [Novosphingobium sp.]
MNPVNPGAGAAGIRDIIALRQQIIDQSQVLQQINAPGTQETGGAAASSSTGGFAENLRSALDKVNDTQSRAEALSEGYEKGEVTDIAKVMLARQEAGLAFEATLQVRNKLLSAYQDIMRMGV